MHWGCEIGFIANEAACADAVIWWEALTEKGGEGLVVEPLCFVAHDMRGLIQPALKMRVREYLRIIHASEYDDPVNLAR